MANFRNNVFGVVTGTSTPTAVPFPDVEAQLVNLRTFYDNKESFFIGREGRVYWDLPPGTETGWFEANNLNELYFYSNSGSSERLTYWVQN